MGKSGILYLVGCGPGNPDTLPLKVSCVLREAEVAVSNCLTQLDPDSLERDPC